MTAAVAAPLLDAIIPDPTAEARKRRREILATQRSVVPDVVVVTNPSPLPPAPADPVAKRPKVEEASTSASTSGKKLQMKYDPDVPMSKDEAAQWRREQRRKRNRESAAASRQRQRDRIQELESEVQDWKTKYDEIMSKIRQIEKDTGSSSIEESEELTSTRPETPPPRLVQTVTPRTSPTSTSSLVSISSDNIMVKSEDAIDSEDEHMEPTKMISRHAVKISGSTLLLPDDGISLLAPEPCLSEETVKIEPIDSTLFPLPDQVEVTVFSDVHADPEFGEFLLDAVDWL